MNTNLITFTPDKTPVVESIVIAEGVGVQHKNVLELIRKYLEDFQAFDGVAFETRKGKPLPQGGFAKATEVALLNENQAYLLFTYLKNTDTARQLKVRLVKAFSEVRNQLKDPVNALLAMSKSEILLMAAETQKKNEALEAKTLQLENKIEEDAPRVEMAKRAIESDGAWLIRKVAKVLGVTQTFLFDFMHQKKILSPRNEPYAKFVQMGVIRPRISSYPDGNGNMRSKITAYVTARGIEYLITRLLKDGILKDRSCIQYELLIGEQ